MLVFYLFICAQVVLESFPVSSSGHLAVLELVTHTSWEQLVALPAHLDTYHHTQNVYHLLHGVSALVIALFFVRSWWPVLYNWRRCWRQIMYIIAYGTIADGITSGFFILMHIYNVHWFPVGLGFIITILALASLYWCKPSAYVPYTWYHAIMLGVVQGCALLPGISRFGLTYVIGRWLRLPPYKACEISFLIEWPLIAAACIASVPLLSNPDIYTQFLNPLTLLVILIAGGGAWAGLALVTYLIRIQRLWLFAFYMIFPLLVWLIQTVYRR